MQGRKALLGYGRSRQGQDAPVDAIDTGLTAEEFDSWTRENGWSVPPHIRWGFVSVLNLPEVSAAAEGKVRVWPASTARTGMQLQALHGGRIELRDGCFFTGAAGQPADKLAWFHAEIGLDIDTEGYYVLRDRVDGATLARLGEEMNWAGPASATMDDDRKRALLEACGPAEIMVVGSPQSRVRFQAQYPHAR
ncbi:hypothetical protein U8326_13460 [Tsuneonella sp. CC-YZS046]|uniref:hypothetical protein n=1 Tax=Tsuneonella sp. CC-YZS046 TaxID=3042152 RepID=UPI002D796F55|nr:hypothetical protein [Tsuneonella sp. CC-YZS046]WRO66039.1 hypothetical protein U8326_13460 [Tsuneonella sp. CC-YZS046]